MINNHGSFFRVLLMVIMFYCHGLYFELYYQTTLHQQIYYFPKGKSIICRIYRKYVFFCWEVLKQIQDNELKINTLHWHVNHVGLELVDQRFRWACPKIRSPQIRRLIISLVCSGGGRMPMNFTTLAGNSGCEPGSHQQEMWRIRSEACIDKETFHDAI